MTKRWGTNDFTEATTLGDVDQGGIVQAGVLKYFKLSTLRAWLVSKALGAGVANAPAAVSGTVTLDLSTADYFRMTLSANVVLAFSNPPAAGVGRTIAVEVQQDATGGRTLGLPTGSKMVTGSDAVVQSGANARTLIIFTSFDQGARWAYTMKGVAP